MNIFRSLRTILLLTILCLPGPCLRGGTVSPGPAVGDALIHKGVYDAAVIKGGGYDFRPMLAS